MELVSLKTIKERLACAKSIKYFQSHFGNDEYTGNELLRIVKEKQLSPGCYNISWLLIHFECCRTNIVLDYLKSQNPGFFNIGLLIRYVNQYRTVDMIKYYKSFDPPLLDRQWIIQYCKIFKCENIKKFEEILEV